MQIIKSKKPTAVVGLDIEAGSIAATELSVNGTVAVKRAAVEPLPPGIFGWGGARVSRCRGSARRGRGCAADRCGRRRGSVRHDGVRSRAAAAGRVGGRRG